MVEGDDVGVGVVVEVLAIVLQEFFVGAGDHTEIPEGFAVMVGHGAKPGLDGATAFHLARDVPVHEDNHRLRRGRWKR